MSTVPEDRRCTARSRRSGERCGRAATPGTNVCASHGSKAPAVRRAAARRVAQAAAEQAVQRTVADRGPLSLSDVYAELLSTAGTVVAWRDLLTARLDELDGRLTYTDGGGTERVKADVQLFTRALDQATRTLELIGRLDLDSRTAALSRRQGEAIAGVIRQVLAGVGLTPEQEARAHALLPGALRELTEDRL